MTISTYIPKKGDIFPLTTLPRPSNSIYQKIPDLKIGDQFIFQDELYSGYQIFQHKTTGQEFSLNLALFLNSDRFYFTYDRTIEKTAILVLATARLFPTTGKRVNGIRIKAGTIFEEYKDICSTYALVTYEGKQYHISRSMCAKLVDTAQESSLNKTPIMPVKQKVVDLTFNRTYSLNGYHFSTQQDMHNAEEYAKQLHALTKSFKFSTQEDADKALQLAKKLCNLSL
jgi:hypothetical protein